ncbi:MAG TPA: hypothetical protein VHZ31_03585 [Solirubrobacteraceae bacterium]|jgi:hypothetical protein|nr:hypothetical protein [Solirubrobacteraceae bacterium]
MTTPRVVELRRSLEATSQDAFARSDDDDPGPLAVVLELRPRDPAALRRAPRRRRGPGSAPDPGPGGCAA